MSTEPEKRSDEAETIVSVPSSRDDALALLAEWRCCGAPNICGARCMDDEESHRLAQFALYIDNEEANNSGLRAALAASRAEHMHERAMAELDLQAARDELAASRADTERWRETADGIREAAERTRDFDRRTSRALLAKLDAARVEVSQLRANAEAVRKLHPVKHDTRYLHFDVESGPEFREGDWCQLCRCTWPCPTVAALAEPLGSTEDPPATEENR